MHPESYGIHSHPYIALYNHLYTMPYYKSYFSHTTLRLWEGIMQDSNGLGIVLQVQHWRRHWLWKTATLLNGAQKRKWAPKFIMNHVKKVFNRSRLNVSSELIVPWSFNLQLLHCSWIRSRYAYANDANITKTLQQRPSCPYKATNSLIEPSVSKHSPLPSTTKS